jgi:glycosyltransferase involved in cell wall biosynthesis
VNLQTPLVSIVVTTRNEEKNIGNCLNSLQLQTWKNIEIIVIDNASTDRTKEIARQYTEKVFDKGPERSAQRNYGISDIATGIYAMFLDADMILAPSVIERSVWLFERPDVVGLHIEEVVLGRGLLARIRRYERAFYSGTVIDGIRFFRRSDFAEIGGFDAALPPGPEDWDLDKRFKKIGNLVMLDTDGGENNPEIDNFVRERGYEPRSGFVGLYHNEDEQPLKRYLSKKAYYSGSMSVYAEKWGENDPDIRRQLGFGYRFLGVFVEDGKWKSILRRPHYFIGVFILRALVGFTYLVRRAKLTGDAK